jgi:hypothetical protein
MALTPANIANSAISFLEEMIIFSIMGRALLDISRLGVFVVWGVRRLEHNLPEIILFIINKCLYFIMEMMDLCTTQNQNQIMDIAN